VRTALKEPRIKVQGERVSTSFAQKGRARQVCEEVCSPSIANEKLRVAKDLGG